MQNNVLDYLNEIVKIKPDKLAFSNGTEGLTFSEVYKQSRSIGTFLHQKGIYRKPVVIFMNKSPKEVTAFFGVLKIFLKSSFVKLSSSTLIGNLP